MMRVFTNKEVPAYKPVDHTASEYIVTSELQDKLVVVDAKKGDYVVQKETAETSRIKTQDYIDSFKDDVGIENILKKFNLVNDIDLFNQRTRPSVAIAEDGKEVVQDYVGVPRDEETALKIAKRAQAEFKALPDELVKGRSFNEFAETCTKDELITFLASLNKKEGE